MSVSFQGVKQGALQSGQSAFIESVGEEITFHNANARALLKLLALPGVDAFADDIMGSVDVHTFVRSVWAAKHRFDRVAPTLARKTIVEKVEGRAYVHASGIDVEGLRVRLARLEEWASELLAESATHVGWA